MQGDRVRQIKDACTLNVIFTIYVALVFFMRKPFRLNLCAQLGPPGSHLSRAGLVSVQHFGALPPHATAYTLLDHAFSLVL